MSDVADWTTPARIWPHYRAPQLPTEPDLNRYERALDVLNPGARVLLLGVTPPLVHLCERLSFAVTAVDGNPRMIEEVWPGEITSEEPSAHSRRAHCRRWDDLRDLGNFDAVIGDGVLAFGGNLVGANKWIDQWSNLLNSGGRLVFRTFTRPFGKEPIRPNAVAAEIMSGRRAIDPGRWDLAFSLLDDEGALVLDALYRAYRETGLKEWMSRTMPAEEGWKFESYQGSTIRYWFPVLEELESLGGAAQFDRHFEVGESAYPLASLCPVTVYTLKE